MFRFHFFLHQASLILLGTLFAMNYATNVSAVEGLTKVTQVEDVTEYRLENGMRLLLVPDESQPKITVNMTILVGSRHEGYGEAGMAHLLEHLVFKGTPSIKDIPGELKSRGAEYNGSTWLDRTNYYETLSASSENLEFALRLEADRLVNSFVAREDLLSEMSIVRSEFENGENNPVGVLLQRMFSAAFQWHNYGQSTIGNRSDIERVPIEYLQKFYRQHYRPENCVLVVAGKFDVEEALELVDEYYSILENPSTPLNKTFTEEPVQDGDRQTVVRRVGNVQWVGAMYHIPAGSDESYAAFEALGLIMQNNPGGRLYKNLVEAKLATGAFGQSFGLHDPGVTFYMAQVGVENSLVEAEEVMLETLEGVVANPITEEELNRAKNTLLKTRELRAGNTQALAIELSEWAAQGDWRLYYLHRDRLEKLTVEQVQAAAERYLVPTNRTVGRFIPTESPVRAEMPKRVAVSKMLEGYTGRAAVSEGEVFEATLANIESRTMRGKTDSGMKYALLPKKTRGEKVNIALSLRFGDEKSMFGKSSAIQMLGSLIERGTQQMELQEYRDKLDELRANVSFGTGTGVLSVSILAKRESIPEVLKLVKQVLRSPKLSEQEFELLREQVITQINSQVTEPQALAQEALQQAFNQYPKGDVRYASTMQESLDEWKSLTVGDVREIYDNLIGAEYAELAAVGDFDPEELKAQISDVLSGWTSSQKFERVLTTPNTSVSAEVKTIETPDKANSVYIAQQQFELRDSDPDYAALTIGNYILGSSALSSRLGDRVRQQEGLSYSVGSFVSAGTFDSDGSLTLFAIANPKNRDKLMATIQEELQKIISEGITQDELEQAKDGFLQQRKISRTDDRSIVRMLASSVNSDRKMDFSEEFESKIATLTTGDVNEALKKLVAPERFVVVTAGDFANAEKYSDDN